MDKNALKKHHFWILAGVAPLFTLLAVLLMMLTVGDEISAKSAEIEKSQKDLSAAKAPGTKVLADYDAQKKVLTEQKDKLWEANWQLQSDKYKLFTWPKDTDPRGRLAKLEKGHPKFGEKINDPNDVLDIFKRPEVYEAAYAKLATEVAPTGFRGGRWQNVLRHVSNWGQRVPTYQQVWLALEDLWVQRGLMQPVGEVNRSAATFALLKPDGQEPGPFARKFRNRVWDLELEIPNNGTDKLVRYKLTNRTDRLQLLGVGNTMRLKVWLSDQPTAQPIELRVEGEFVRAGDSVDNAKQQVARLHGIPPGVTVEKLARVEQVLDSRTVPVRRVENLSIGYLSSRHGVAQTALKPPAFMEGDAAPAAPAGPPGARPPGAPAALPPGLGDGGDIDPTAGLAVPAFARAAKFGPPEAVLNANKNRYLEVTSQVRRLPFAVVLLVDQMFVQDALVAYANSPLRCQITQFHWRRYRQNLNNATTPGSPDPNNSNPGDVPPPPTEPEVITLPANVPGLPPAVGGTGFGGSAVSSVSEGQVTSGLVELTIYGVATLYERYEKPKPPEGETPAGTTPTADAPVTPANDGTKPDADAAKPDANTPNPETTPKPDADAPKPPAPAGPPATQPTPKTP